MTYLTMISKAELIAALQDSFSGGKENYNENELTEIIERLTEIEIINCFECKYYNTVTGCGLGRRTNNRPFTEYCLEGERKEKMKQFERDEIMLNDLKAKISTCTRNSEIAKQALQIADRYRIKADNQRKAIKDLLKEKRKQAYWIYLGDDTFNCYRCSNCGNGSEYATKYCCDCGFEMSEKELSICGSCKHEKKSPHESPCNSCNDNYKGYEKA